MKAIEMVEVKGKALPLIRQREQDVTYAPKLKKSDGLINWNDPPAVIHNKVRGFLPWPGAYTHYDGKVLKVLRTEISKVSFNSAASGEVVAASVEQGIVVHAGSGTISIKELQPEGKKAMDSGAFLLGHALKKGYRFK
jgi:methionyl-tRNA formyltransferase